MPTYFPFKGKTTKPYKSLQLYFQRKYYKIATTVFYNEINKNYIDLWYDVPYYGKVDRKGFLVAPKKVNLTYSFNEDLVTHKFVAQAFNEAMYFLNRASAAGRTRLGGLLNDFSPRRSFIDSENNYLAYTASILELFNSEILIAGKRVLNFDNYVCQFLKYLFSTQDAFFSYYSIFAGFSTPIGASGLAIEFDVEDHDNDDLKNKFYSDNEFGKYVNTMANFGFRINKNAPWQIIADLNSKPMLHGRNIKFTNPDTGATDINRIDGYMPQNFIPNVDFLFEREYNRVMVRSLFLLKDVLNYGYNQYQKSAKYVVLHGKPQLKYNESFRLITFSDVFRPPSKKVFIKNYNQIVGLNNMHVIKDTLAPYGYTENYFVKILEKILKNEYSIKNNRKYHDFKKKFDRSFKNGQYFRTLELMEKFYSPTKIYDPETKKPLWDMKKNNLTKQDKQNMIPDEQRKPTVERVVSEFYTGN